MKRISALLMCTLLGATATATLASTAGATAGAHATLFHTVEQRKTKVGEILVNSAGSILYEFTRDPSKKDSCVKISGCSAIWTPLPVQGKPSAGSGVHSSLLSSIALPGGVRQVTYAGHPLYIYTPAPTLTSYIGVKQFGGSWDAVNASGHAIR